MWWSAWSRNQTDMPVAGSSRRCSQARHRASRRLMASAWRHHSGHQRALRAVERAAVHGRELLAHELLDGPVEQLRRRRGLLGLGGGHAARRPSRSLQPGRRLAPWRRAARGPRGRAGAATAAPRRRAALPSTAVSRTSVGGAPEASTIARPLGSAGQVGDVEDALAVGGVRRGAAAACACEIDELSGRRSRRSAGRGPARKSASATPPP